MGSELMGLEEYISGFKIKTRGLSPSQVWHMHEHGLELAMNMDKILHTTPTLHKYMSQVMDLCSTKEPGEIMDRNMDWHDWYLSEVQDASRVYLESVNDHAALR